MITKPCDKCGRELRHVRDLVGVGIRNGKYEVWTHTDTGYAPCNVTSDGIEIEPPLKVWVALTNNGNDTITVCGVFTTEEAADKCAHEAKARNHEADAYSVDTEFHQPKQQKPTA
jgi:hypothetical protein